MARLSFWILLFACVVVACSVYVFRVDALAGSVREGSRELQASADRAELAASVAVGGEMLQAQRQARDKAVEAYRNLAAWFNARNDQNLTRWFPDLSVTSWGEEPLREDFKRYYNLARDRLVREIAPDLERHGLQSEIMPLVEHPWLRGEELPEKSELRRYQKDFWVQDRLVRAFVRRGAVLVRPIQGGDNQPGVGLVAGGGPFDEIRYDVRVRCSSLQLLNVLHALDGPVEISHEDGSKEDMSLNVIVDRVEVQRLNVDAALANRYAGEPPVEVTFYLTVLDFDLEKFKQ